MNNPDVVRLNLHHNNFTDMNMELVNSYIRGRGNSIHLLTRLFCSRLIIIIIINFYSPVSNTRCHSIGHKMRIARIKIRVDSPGRWERA